MKSLKDYQEIKTCCGERNNTILLIFLTLYPVFDCIDGLPYYKLSLDTHSPPPLVSHEFSYFSFFCLWYGMYLVKQKVATIP
jgi:hypothetical protein